MVAHVRALWPGWGFLLPAPLVLWPLYRLGQGEVRWEYFVFLLLPPLLAYGNETTKKLFLGLYPLGMVGVLYDSMRLVQHVGVTAARVHVCDLRDAELRWFGVDVAGQRVTVHDWLQAHPLPALDLYFALPYAIFLFAYVGFAVLLWRRDLLVFRRFTWCFFALNAVGFTTYHVFPAAPPWYFHAHGCAVDLAAHATEGPNLARVDAWLGVHYFHAMYGRASDVFGAIPSLHCAYPLVMVLEGWQRLGRLGRAATVVYCVSMWCAAVYLDHHWIIDVLVGIVYAVGTVALLRYLFALPADARAPVTERGVP